MKIKPEHLAILRGAVTAVVNSPTAEGCEARYKAGNFTPKRLRWDLLWAARLPIGDGAGMSGLPLYAYMNDDHIDTALRSTMKELKLDWAALP